MNEENITRSIAQLKRVLTRRFGNGIELYLYGSVARKDYQSESDIDILVLFSGEVDTGLMEQVIESAYDVELEHDVVFGIVVQSKEYWESPRAAVTPFRQNLRREALRL